MKYLLQYSFHSVVLLFRMSQNQTNNVRRNASGILKQSDVSWREGCYWQPTTASRDHSYIIVSFIFEFDICSEGSNTNNFAIFKCHILRQYYREEPALWKHCCICIIAKSQLSVVFVFCSFKLKIVFFVLLFNFDSCFDCPVFMNFFSCVCETKICKN